MGPHIDIEHTPDLSSGIDWLGDLPGWIDYSRLSCRGEWQRRFLNHFHSGDRHAFADTNLQRDVNFSGATSGAAIQTVNQAPDTISLSSNLNPSAFGQAATLIATLPQAGATGR